MPQVHPDWLMFVLAIAGVLVQVGINLGAVNRLDRVVSKVEQRVLELEKSLARLQGRLDGDS